MDEIIRKRVEVLPFMQCARFSPQCLVLLLYFQVVLTLLVVIWGLRLALFLLMRCESNSFQIFFPLKLCELRIRLLNWNVFGRTVSIFLWFRAVQDSDLRLLNI